MTGGEILLLPGNMCDSRLWSGVEPELRQSGFEVIHGPPLVRDTIAAMAYDVLAAMPEDATVVGFSMGAIVAATLARRAPERVRSLALVAFNASADLPERAAARPRQQDAVRAGRLGPVVAEELKPNYLAPANRDDQALRSLVMDMALDLGPDVFVAQSEALRRRPDLRPDLAGLKMPVLLACGTEDHLCPPEWHYRWAGMIGPLARVAAVPGAGHLVPLERPRELSRVLLDWLAKEIECPTS